MNEKNRTMRKEPLRKSFNGTAIPKTKVPDLLGFGIERSREQNN